MLTLNDVVVRIIENPAKLCRVESVQVVHGGISTLTSPRTA